MPNQKGSLIDRLRSWRLFLKYKFKMAKKRKEEKIRKKNLEKELKKNVQINVSGKYYSKPKVFGLTIVGLFLGIFESKSSKQSKITKLEEKVTLLESRVEVLSLEEKNILTTTIEKEIVELKANNQFDGEIKSKIKACENRIKTVKAKELTREEQVKQPAHQKPKLETKLNISNQKKDLAVKKESVKVNKNLSNLNRRKKGVYTPVLEIKVINKEIKDYDKKLKEINNKIKSTTDYNNLYELEFTIKQLKIRFNDLLNKYNNLKELPGFDNLENIIDIKDIDIFNLRFNANSIDLKIKECNAYLDSVEARRKEILNKKEDKVVKEKEIKKEEKSKEKKKEVKKEEKKVDQKILEINLANKIILDRLATEKRNIAKFNRSISKMGVKRKKRSIFYYTKNILSSVVNLSFSLFPISFFKNRFIGGLTSGIMINNSLRSIKRVLTPDVETVYILYSDFEKELNQTSDYLNNISYVCSDSLKQINEIRNTIYMQYGNDLEYSTVLEDYIKDLDNIESQILKERETIIDLEQQVQVTKIKNKQKIKEWK